MGTFAHKSIGHCLSMLAPESCAVTEGQKQFRRLMVDIYQGMLRDPEAYLVFPEPYERYIAGHPPRHHVTDSRESTLRNTVQQAIQFYAMVFYHLGVNSSDLEDGALVLTADAYDAALGQLARYHGAEHNEARYAVLKRHGVEVTSDGVIRIRCGLAMESVRDLCMRPESKYKLMNFLRLDFAHEGPPAVEDICLTLRPEHARAVRLMEQQLAGMTVKAKVKPLRGITSDHRWKVEYTCKGRNVCGFYGDCDGLMLCLYFGKAETITAFAKRLEEEEPALLPWFRKQFPERLCQCRYNRRVDLSGEVRRICGMANRAEINAPTPEDAALAVNILQRIRGG